MYWLEDQNGVILRDTFALKSKLIAVMDVVDFHSHAVGSGEKEGDKDGCGAHFRY